MPVVLATEEAEAGELHEPRRRSLQIADITPLHKRKKEKKRKGVRGSGVGRENEFSFFSVSFLRRSLALLFTG